MSTESVVRNCGAEILSRVIEPEIPGFSPEVAQTLLKFGFTEGDKARMHVLAVRNQEDHLSAEERGELEDYIRIRNLLALLHFKARRSLKVGNVDPIPS